jgi:hypothetical protein
VFWAETAASERTGFSIPAELAAAHNFLGDSAGALHLLAANDLTEVDVQGRMLPGSDPYTVSVASTGRFADADFDSDYDAVDFLYEKGDLAAAQNTVSKLRRDSAYPWGFLACAAYEMGNHDVFQFVTTKMISHPPTGDWTLAVAERFLISVGERDEAQKIASANKSDPYNAKEELSGKMATEACNRGFWWGKSRRNYLVEFALNGLVLDSKKQFNDTDLDDFLRQQAALMTSPDSGDDARQQDVAVALEAASNQVQRIAGAYRKIRGPKSD